MKTKTFKEFIYNKFKATPNDYYQGDGKKLREHFESGEIRITSPDMFELVDEWYSEAEGIKLNATEMPMKGINLMELDISQKVSEFQINSPSPGIVGEICNVKLYALTICDKDSNTIFHIKQNGDIVLRGVLIGNDKEVADILINIGKIIKMCN